MGLLNSTLLHAYRAGALDPGMVRYVEELMSTPENSLAALEGSEHPQGQKVQSEKQWRIPPPGVDECAVTHEGVSAGGGIGMRMVASPVLGEVLRSGDSFRLV